LNVDLTLRAVKRLQKILLQRPRACRSILVKFDASPAYTADQPPAILARNVTQLRHRKSANDPKLGWMRNEILGLDGQHPRNLRNDRRQLPLPGHDEPARRRVGGGFVGKLFPGKIGGSFVLRFSLLPRATCAFRDGDGPLAAGFSVRLIFF
jgi:hypothetical protein